MPEHWRQTIPAAAPDECQDATSFGEALYFALLELKDIEAANILAGPPVRALRKWVMDNRQSLADFMGKNVDELDL